MSKSVDVVTGLSIQPIVVAPVFSHVESAPLSINGNMRCGFFRLPDSNGRQRGALSRLRGVIRRSLDAMLFVQCVIYFGSGQMRHDHAPIPNTLLQSQAFIRLSSTQAGVLTEAIVQDLTKEENNDRHCCDS